MRGFRSRLLTALAAICAMIAFGGPATAQSTTIDGDIVVEAGGVLELSPGSTRYTGSLTLEEGVKVVAPPFATIKFLEGASLFINGTPDDPVELKPTSTDARWAGIFLDNDATAVVHHAEFERAETGIGLNPGASLIIRNSSFSQPGGNNAGFEGRTVCGIRVGRDATLDADGCEFGPLRGGVGPVLASGHGDTGGDAIGVEAFDAGDIRITNCVFQNITGGRGGHGNDGVDGTNAGQSGTSGKFGGSGGDAFALHVSTSGGQQAGGETVFAQNLVLVIKGGVGGNGGDGGDGQRGLDGQDGQDGGPTSCGTDGFDGGRGGDAGQGGRAGEGGEASTIYLIDPRSAVTITNNTFASMAGGLPGVPGDGGRGGWGGSGGSGGCGWFCCANGGNDGGQGYDGFPGFTPDQARASLLIYGPFFFQPPPVLVANNIVLFPDSATSAHLVLNRSGITLTRNLFGSLNPSISFNEPGNINANAEFVNAANGNYALVPGSVGVDAGDNTLVDAGLATDLVGNPRFLDDPAAPDTGIGGGAGAGAIVDIGAFEQRVGARCNAADLAEPYGQLDLADIGVFVTAFTSGDAIADLAAPAGVIDLADISVFVTAFTGGCP